MKFRLVEDTKKLDESAVSPINRAAKKIMKSQSAQNPQFQIDPSMFDHCLRHHLGGPSDYESSSDLQQGKLNPSIIIPQLEDPELTYNAIHFIIEHYSGTNFFHLIRYIAKICKQDAIYHCSNNGTVVFKTGKLYDLITKWNKGAI